MNSDTVRQGQIRCAVIYHICVCLYKLYTKLIIMHTAWFYNKTSKCLGIRIDQFYFTNFI